jgi:hypothetical protein
MRRRTVTVRESGIASMVAPPPGQIERLLASLASTRSAERDSAVARLTLLGKRTVDPILGLLKSAPPPVVCQALTVLEQVRAERALPAICDLAAHSDPVVAGRAIEALGTFDSSATALAHLLHSAPLPLRPVVVESLRQLLNAGSPAARDALGGFLHEEGSPEDLRLAALEALAALPSKDLVSILKRLRPGRGSALDARVALLIATHEDTVLPRLLGRLERAQPSEEERLLSRLCQLGSKAAERLVLRLGDSNVSSELLLRIGRALARIEPLHGIEAVCRALGRATLPLAGRVLVDTLGHWRTAQAIPALHATLKRAAGGALGAAPETVAELKARTHLALAACGSAIALYDLREMLRLRPPVATATLLRAAALMDTGPLLPDIVALAHDDDGAFEPCAEAFAQIAGRGGLRRNSRVLKAIPALHAPTLERLWRETQTTRRYAPPSGASPKRSRP